MFFRKNVDFSLKLRKALCVFRLKVSNHSVLGSELDSLLMMLGLETKDHHFISSQQNLDL